MKVGIVSDIHGNFHALKAVERELDKKGVEEVWCLGDTVGYGAFPEECLKWVKENCSTVILGNHELAVLGLVDISMLNEFAAKSITWTRRKLTKESVDYLSELNVQEINKCCHLVHDTPSSPGSMEYILSKEQAYRALLKQKKEIALFGHTHIPAVYRLFGSGVDRLSPKTVRLSGGRYLLNPGSVGQPRDRNPWASFAVLDGEVFTVYRVEYDVKAAAREILRAGLPKFLAARLVVGV